VQLSLLDMNKETPIFNSLDVVRHTSNEFFRAIQGWKGAEIENLSPEHKDFVQDRTMRMMYACMDVLARINPDLV